MSDTANEPWPEWLQEISRTFAVSDDDVPMLEAAYAAGRAAALAQAARIAREARGGFSVSVYSASELGLSIEDDPSIAIWDKDGPWVLGHGVAKAIEELADLPDSAGRAARWTYVEDGLPETPSVCQAAVEVTTGAETRRMHRSAFFLHNHEGGCWFDDDGYHLPGVYAWAPLGELPPRRER